MIWNSKYSTEPMRIVQGDDINMVLNIQEYDYTVEQWVDYDLTGKSLRLVIKNNHGTTIADWSTTGGELTNVGSALYITDTAINSVSCCGSFNGHLRELSPNKTLWKSTVTFEGSLI